MDPRKTRSRLQAILPEAVAGLGVFLALLALSVADGTLQLPAGNIFQFVSRPGLVADGFGRPGMLVLLAAVAAALASLNVAFFHHLVRTYAPRRSREPCPRERSTRKEQP